MKRTLVYVLIVFFLKYCFCAQNLIYMDKYYNGDDHFCSFVPITNQVVLEGLRREGSEGYMAWDDLTVKRGACADPGTCDFEGGLCGWTDATESGDYGWVWLAAEEAGNGIVTDHTTETSKGQYGTSSLLAVSIAVVKVFLNHYKPTPLLIMLLKAWIIIIVFV